MKDWAFRRIEYENILLLEPTQDLGALRKELGSYSLKPWRSKWTKQIQLSRDTYYSAWHRAEIFIFSFTEMPTKSSQPFQRNTHKKAGRIRPWRQSFSEVLFLSKKQTERLRRASNRGKICNFFFFSSTQIYCLSERKWDMPWNLARILLIFYMKRIETSCKAR